jgi:hypothetical protein
MTLAAARIPFLMNARLLLIPGATTPRVYYVCPREHDRDEETFIFANIGRSVPVSGG